MAGAEAAFKLAACCGSSKWVAEMLAARPFKTRARVFSAAEQAAGSLGADDWLEAFSHHPQIGATSAAAEVSSSAKEWSAGEQSGVISEAEAVRDELAEANREYCERFGYIFIICATGKTASEMLASLRERMNNSPARELAAAAREQQMITRLRLNKLITS